MVNCRIEANFRRQILSLCASSPNAHPQSAALTTCRRLHLVVHAVYGRKQPPKMLPSTSSSLQHGAIRAASQPPPGSNMDIPISASAVSSPSNRRDESHQGHYQQQQQHPTSAAPPGATICVKSSSMRPITVCSTEPDEGMSQPLGVQWTYLPTTAKVSFVTGAYILVAGLAALLFPCQLLVLLFPASNLSPGWVRVGATLAILFGAYYLGAAMDDMEGRKPVRMYQATVLGRVFLSLVFGWLVATEQGGLGLGLLAAVNVIGAWSMVRALRSDGLGWS